MSELEQTLTLLREVLGVDAVRTGEQIGPQHYCDWTGYAPSRPAALLLPRDTAQVSAALRICHARGQSVVPQGGMTGLAGGGTPRPHDIALSLERLVGIEQLDPASTTLRVRAGTRLEVIQEAARDAGLLFPLDIGARGSCQIGGNIATNAGGNSVIRYGMTRDLVLGLEVVLADGQVLDLLNNMIKNNTGYDLKQCFIGSEGTLGVITRAVLRLAPLPGPQITTICALPDYQAAVALLRRLQRAVGTPQAYELMWQDFYQLGVSWLEPPKAPLDPSYPLFVLFNSVTHGEQLESALAEAIEAGEVLDAAIATSHAQAAQMWRIREATGEFPTRMAPLNFDVSLPIGSIGEFVDSCRCQLQERWPEHRSYYFGHIGDSNLHLTVDCRSLPQPAPIVEIEALVYEAVGKMGGSISAEHGIGLLKREFLHYSVTPAALTAMHSLKTAFDPKGILNPGKLLPP